MNKFQINLDECKKFDIKIDVLFFLLSLYFDNPINRDTIVRICGKGLVDYNGFDINQNFLNPKLSQQGCELIEELLANSKTDDSVKDDLRYQNLAEKLIELYPKGKKPGTVYMWRDSKMIIAKRLKILANKYNISFSDEDAINATKRYIDSFNGNYSYMQILKYFISKKDKVTGEESSQLLSYIENKDENNTNTDVGILI